MSSPTAVVDLENLDYLYELTALPMMMVLVPVSYTERRPGIEPTPHPVVPIQSTGPRSCNDYTCRCPGLCYMPTCSLNAVMDLFNSDCF